MIILFLCIGIFLFLYTRGPKEQYLIIEEYKSRSLESIEWIGVAPDGISTCLVEYGGRPSRYDIVPGKYIVHEELEGYKRYIYLDGEYIGEECCYEDYQLYVYDLVTHEKRTIYDMNDFMEQNYPGCYISAFSDEVFSWNGQNVYTVRIWRRIVKNEYPWNVQYLYINTEDGSFEEHEDDPEKNYSSTTDGVFYNTDGTSLFEQNLPEGILEEICIFTYQNYEGIFEVRGLAEYLPEHNDVLYGMFPELEQYRGEEDCYICLYIGGNPTAEELLRLFMEDGQEISFEGVVLPGKYSIDGEDHEIHSFEEYEQWYDEEWNSRS